MTKKRVSAVCKIIAAILTAVFIIMSIVNCIQYDPIVNSAPAYVLILLNALYFLLPALIAFIAGILIGKKK